MFSLPTLPVHCCSTLFTDVPSTSSSILVTLLLVRKRAVLRETDDGQWRWQFWRNVILSVQVLVKAVGVKLLKVISTEITFF